MMVVSDTILRNIFLKIPELITLLQLRQVSRIWGNLIEEIFEKQNYWKHLCTSSNNINPWVYSITEIIFPNKIKDWSRPFLSKSWKKIFLFYIEWNFGIRALTPKLPDDLQNVEHFSDEVSAIDVHDTYIAISYRQTEIKIFENMLITRPTYGNDFKSFHLYSLKTKIKKIIKIKFWFTNSKQLILVVHLSHRLANRLTLKYFDVFKKQKIKNPFKNQKNIQNFTCSSHRLFIATSDNIYECIWEDNKLALGHAIFEIRTILNRNEMQQMKILEMCVKSDSKVDRLAVLIKITPNTVRAVTFKLPRNGRGRFKQLYYDRDIIINRDGSSYYIPMPGIVFIVDDSEMIINLWWPLLDMQEEDSDQENIIIPLKHPEVLDLSRDGNQSSSSQLFQSPSSLSNVGGFRDNPLINVSLTYKLLRSGRLKITSILLFCNILILGLQSGDVEIFFLKNIKTLTNTDFYSIPRKVMKICEEPIININLFQKIKDSYSIIITTSKAMHFRKWIYPENRELRALSVTSSDM